MFVMHVAVYNVLSNTPRVLKRVYM